MICNKEKCTGCFACYNSCPKKAIDMVEDELGYIYPQINSNKCVGCNICKKVCPALNKVEFLAPKSCYAARAKEEKILKNSSSGGIAMLISKKIIELDGIVYGAAFVENGIVEHMRITNIDDLKKIQGSKYVHSYINDVFKKVNEDLILGRYVLFIGTPCQVAGLKKYLIKDYDKLYVIDLICHGVPSQKYLKDEIKRVIKNNNYTNVTFRGKDDYFFSIKDNEKILFKQEWEKSPYFYTFMNAEIFRNNCYSCKYAKKERCSDLTIGDFWGIKNNSIFYDTKHKGISVILQITDKGKFLFNLIENDIVFEKRDINEACSGNSQLRETSKKSKNSQKFELEYNKKKNFYKTYKKIFFIHYIKNKVKNISVINFIYNYLKGRNKNEKK